MKQTTGHQIIPNIGRIEILLKSIDHRFLEGMFIDYFGRNDSPTAPICVIFDSPWKANNEGTVDVEFRNFRIVEIRETPELTYEVLAKIVIQQYPFHAALFIYKEKDDEETWSKIISITKAIISKLKQLRFEIESVIPTNLFPQDMIPKWEQIEDHYSDRSILEMWHKGHTYKEIGLSVNKSPDTVGNILSDLRTRYGKDIVPTDNQRKSRNFGK